MTSFIRFHDYVSNWHLAVRIPGTELMGLCFDLHTGKLINAKMAYFFNGPFWGIGDGSQNGCDRIVQVNMISRDLKSTQNWVIFKFLSHFVVTSYYSQISKWPI